MEASAALYTNIVVYQLRSGVGPSSSADNVNLDSTWGVDRATFTESTGILVNKHPTAGTSRLSEIE